jgi:phospholipid N-methyltransferase
MYSSCKSQFSDLFKRFLLRNAFDLLSTYFHRIESSILGGASFIDSKLFVIEIIENKLSNKAHLSILDLGMGTGELGYCLHKYFKDKKQLVIDGIDAYLLFDHRVNTLYHTIQKRDIRELTKGNLNKYDLVVCLDCLEHMPYHDSVSILNLLRSLDSHVIVGFPNWRLPQDQDTVIHEYGIHRSHIDMLNMAKFVPDIGFFTTYGYACYYFSNSKKIAYVSDTVLKESDIVSEAQLNKFLKDNGVKESGCYRLENELWVYDNDYSYREIRNHLRTIFPDLKNAPKERLDKIMFYRNTFKTSLITKLLTKVSRKFFITQSL